MTRNEALMDDFLHIGHMLRRKRFQHRDVPCEAPHGLEAHHEPEEHHGPEEHREGPPMARHHVLRIIAEHPEGISQNQIAGDVGIRPQSMSELLSKLESEGMITREKNPDDKREMLVYLTEKGRIRHEETENRRRQDADELLAKLTEEEAEELRILLDKILSVVDSDTWC